MLNKIFLPALLLTLSFSVRSFAADEKKKSEGQSDLKIEDVNSQKNKVAGDIDEEITNAKMRAESGSKSKWSLSTTETYTGGAISSPFAADRPNIKGTPEAQRLTSIGGGLNGRYRMTKNDSFTAGTTFAIMTPFEGQPSDGTQQFNVFDPNVGYNHSAKVGAFQTAAILGYSYGTSNESRAVDMTHQFGGAYNAMHDFHNGLTAGAQVAVDYNLFTTAAGTSSNPDTHRRGYGGDTRVDWDFAIYPQAEYKINDTFSARTVFGYFNWKHLYGDVNTARLLHTFTYQSLGIGISVTRDIFLYPNVQFIPDNMRSNFTNVAMSATINIF